MARPESCTSYSEPSVSIFERNNPGISFGGTVSVPSWEIGRFRADLVKRNRCPVNPTLIGSGQAFLKASAGPFFWNRFGSGAFGDDPDCGEHRDHWFSIRAMWFATPRKRLFRQDGNGKNRPVVAETVPNRLSSVCEMYAVREEVAD